MPETPEQFWERARAGLQTPPVEEDSWPPRVPSPTPGDTWRANLELVRGAFDGEVPRA